MIIRLMMLLIHKLNLILSQTNIDCNCVYLLVRLVCQFHAIKNYIYIYLYDSMYQLCSFHTRIKLDLMANIIFAQAQTTFLLEMNAKFFLIFIWEFRNNIYFIFFFSFFVAPRMCMTSEIYPQQIVILLVNRRF
jgi:hypothetical protein